MSKLKEIYIKKNNLNKKTHSVRMIYQGFEIKDGQYLYVNKFESNKENFINVIVRYFTAKNVSIKNSAEAHAHYTGSRPALSMRLRMSGTSARY